MQTTQTSDLQALTQQAATATRELLACANLQKGDILVVGCSSSEVIGQTIGKASSWQAAQAVYQGIAPVLQEHGVFLAAQCCEHLNRCLIIERAAVQDKNDIVSVVPQPKAGGSFATAAWQAMEQPVAVCAVQADAGMDVGDTLIGMHLRRVAVPVRVSIRAIGQANLVCARTRPAYVGGARAVYQADVHSAQGE